MKIFPDLVQPQDDDAGVDPVTHVRYPEDLFEVQRALLAQYHVDDPVTFYNVGDKWTVPTDPTADATGEPAAVLRARRAAERDERRAAVPADLADEGEQAGTYLAAYISVDSDPGAELRQDHRAPAAARDSTVQGPNRSSTLQRERRRSRRTSDAARSAAAVDRSCTATC